MRAPLTIGKGSWRRAYSSCSFSRRSPQTYRLWGSDDLYLLCQGWIGRIRHRADGPERPSGTGGVADVVLPRGSLSRSDCEPAPRAGRHALNCTVAFYDGTVNFAGGVTGYATDGYTTTTTVYDQLGQVVGVTNSLGDTIVLSPERGELSTITDPGGHTTTFSYDAAGSVAQVSDPMGHTTRYTYDASERATTVTDPLSHTTSYGYDAEGRMITSIDTGGNTTTNTYDSGGRLIGQSDTSGDTTTYAYDSSGRLSEVSDNQTTTYSYDAMNRLISETMTPPSGGLTTTVTYDANGNVISVSESSGPVTTYTYDDLNRVIQQTETADGVMDTTTYTYDAAGDLISVTDPADNVTKFTYDPFGDLISMADPNSGAITFAYFAVPEPSTWAAMLLGFAGLAFAGRKKTSWVKAGFWPPQAVKAPRRPARP